MAAFAEKYGPWALVAGASEGLGEAFAEALAKRGLNLILIARRAALLTALCDRLHTNYKVETRALPLDLGGASFVETLGALAGELEIGLGIYNAAYAFIAPLL